MRPRDRRSAIAEAVAREGRRSVEALATAFEVSTETIRRDLATLAAAGMVEKVHGGATPPRLRAEGSFGERMAEDAAAKRAIARTLPSFVEPGATLFVDTGSTTLVAARELARVDDLTVITNSHAVAAVFDGGGRAQVFLLGGTYRAANGQTVGPLAIEQAGRFEADIALLTVAALDVSGAMDSDFDEAQVARAMSARARRTVVVAASSKFGRRAAHKVCRLRALAVLVSECAPTGELAAALHASGVRVVAAHEPHGAHDG